MDATSGDATSGRFTGLADVYDRFRPSYPDACLDDLGPLGAGPGGVVADVGAGTGLFTELLARRGASVVAVEPNPDMIAVARRRLAGLPGVCIVEAAAERTGLDAGSVDLVTAAQAFHWFDPDAFRAECLRILHLDGRVALIWNSRTPGHPLHEACARICERHCPDFEGFSGDSRQTRGDDTRRAVDRFFAGGAAEEKDYPNDLELTREAFVGRHLSASYAPRPGSPEYGPFVGELDAVFDRFATGWTLTFPNTTSMHVGRPLAAPATATTTTA